MIYRNLDQGEPRAFRDLLRWQLERRKLPPAPPELSQTPAVLHNDGSALHQGNPTLTWIGHASVIVQVNGYTVLCDPVWSNRISGIVPRLSQPGLMLENVPRPDVILISHNHYDHLDLPTLRRFGLSIPVFVPSGLGAYLRRLGFMVVREFDWWDNTRLGEITITFVPAQHWSRRLPWDTNQSWWGGWVLEGEQRIYFAGDTGFFSGFVPIAQRFPGLDWAILPIGAYEPRWFMRGVHMNPEEAGAAFAMLQARQMLPIHYGTFKLTDEPVGQPVPRIEAWWQAHGLAADRLWLPQLGETRQLLPQEEVHDAA